ncbi:MAG: hypothetical protein VZQ78_12050 [Prevotella sp.]|nr:hypothetical protein [Prevotella sp.]
MTDKIIRFSELTPAKLLHANSVKVVIPDTDAVLAFEHETDGSWTFVTHSKKFDSFFPGCPVMHAINEEAVWALYCGLTLTLCGVADKTYDDVEVFYYGREDEHEEKEV